MTTFNIVCVTVGMCVCDSVCMCWYCACVHVIHSDTHTCTIPTQWLHSGMYTCTHCHTRTFPQWHSDMHTCTIPTHAHTATHAHSHSDTHNVIYVHMYTVTPTPSPHSCTHTLQLNFVCPWPPNSSVAYHEHWLLGNSKQIATYMYTHAQ